MSKNRVFIYGSCVSRDMFEYLDPDQFELVQYVARQSALSAYTRPVTLVEPPAADSTFQQRMLAGDFASSLQTLIPQAATTTDLVLVDLTDERLGAYVLPDGSVVTRSLELIQSGAENALPVGSQHLAFGTDKHFQYWSQGIAAVGELIRYHMPRAAVILLDIPWAEKSESGERTPDSFGTAPAEANAALRVYTKVAADSLNAQTITIEHSDVTSNPHHRWGEAPFHYSDRVYQLVADRLNGPSRPGGVSAPGPTTRSMTSHTQNSASARPAGRDPIDETFSSNGANFFIAGTQKAGTAWLSRELSRHPEIFVASGSDLNFFNEPNPLANDDAVRRYLAKFDEAGDAKWRGEHTSAYFWHAASSPFSPRRTDVASTISTLVPDARILISLRDPVSRAIAGYWHHFAAGRIDPDAGIFRVSNGLGVVDLGFYRRHYLNWLTSIDASRIFTLLYDDMLTKPKDYIASTVEFLGLDASPEYLESLSGRGREETGPNWLAPFKKKYPIAAQEVAALVELYRDDITFVEELLERDLPAWRDVESLMRRIQ